ncbi:2-aminoethanethiol dioxygenase [Chrysochromulina tobinii]|uniref:2-aminoethanethiol dioxygenase n=1 Tax=Chrysochromulina tobinii TaxID=1460289 RepID=A0A0M0K5E7_9EUKA|nr:2-aminoethanethiol dioxygenase [Chrysochromulina tobinii]|eukprot:KOO33837.1 2-aminoethanethiol dioxygenase [Chrysochromulina sp. CCMP291]
MDELTAEDLGVTTAGLTPGGPVGYHHVYADQDISVGIFVLPAGSAIPLHDHPGMSVLSKVLFGKLEVTSFDRPLPSASPSPPPPKFGGPFTLFGGRGASQQLQCAAPVRHTVVAPCPTLRLDPVRGNIHEFVAVEHTAIFDVLTPPYDDRSGRSCHYYEVEAPGAVLDAQPLDSVQLREIGWPPSLRVVNRPYRGPQVSPN